MIDSQHRADLTKASPTKQNHVLFLVLNFEAASEGQNLWAISRQKHMHPNKKKTILNLFAMSVAFIPFHQQIQSSAHSLPGGWPWFCCTGQSCAGSSTAASCTRGCASRAHQTWSLHSLSHRTPSSQNQQTCSCSPTTRGKETNVNAGVP